MDPVFRLPGQGYLDVEVSLAAFPYKCLQTKGYFLHITVKNISKLENTYNEVLRLGVFELCFAINVILIDVQFYVNFVL